MIQQLLFMDERIEATVNYLPLGTEVLVGENRYLISEIGSGKFKVVSDGVSKTVCCIVKGNKSFIDIDGLLLEMIVPSEDSSSATSAGAHAVAKDKIFAPMPGKIVKLLIREGDEVAAKQPMVIVEAMKMENQVNSPAAGKVKKINFKDGDQVGTEIPIIELELP